MKFAFMARILDYEGYGVQTHLMGLLKAISKTDHKHKLVIFMGPNQKADLSFLRHRFELVRFGPSPKTPIGRMIWDHISVGRVCQQMKIDALYAPAHIKPALINCPTVVFVPDMIYHLFPEQWSWSDRFYFTQAVNRLTSRAQSLIALSENTRKDLLSKLRVPSDRIKVVYPGVPEGFMPKPPQETEYIRSKYGLEKPFLLYVGSFHPRKNVPAIISAFECLADKNPHDLVLVGSPVWHISEMKSRIENSSFSSRIRSIGLVPRSELPCFYNQASIFIFPSLYEGFGFPVLEALACGCPTVTSNVSSLPEVAGEAAILIDPFDIQEISNAIMDILIDDSLKDELKQRSIIQAMKFSWVETATQTINILTSVAT
jgi:glycosyltransferase involved in cell wall biosynthesis